MFLEGNQRQVCACLCYSLPTIMTVKAQLRNQTIAYKCGGAVNNFQISSSIASKMLLKFFHLLIILFKLWDTVVVYVFNEACLFIDSLPAVY